MSNCMSIVNDMDDESQSALLLKIDEYQKAGMSTKSAQIAAVDAMLSELGMESDSTQVQRSAKDQTETPEFKEWFGDSKVVDAYGKPLVVYKGDNSSPTIFKDGANFFTSSEKMAQGYGKDVRKFFLSIKSPASYDDVVSAARYIGWSDNAIEDEIAGIILADERVPKRLKSLGFDGWIGDDDPSMDDYDELDPQPTFVPFSPTQIKSTTGNNGNFDAKDPDITHSIRDLGFYSELAKQISNASMKQAPATEWKSFIKALSAKGVKADEIEWSGVNEFLDLRNGKVSKSELIDYLNSDGVQVDETILGGDTQYIYTVYRTDFQGKNRVDLETFDTMDEAEDFMNWSSSHDDTGNKYRINEEPIESKSDTKFEDYRVKGGDNYREVLLTLPDASNKRFEEIASEMLTATPEQYAKLHAERAVLFNERNTTYTSSHWNQENVVAHLRIDDRTDSDGESVLFVQELQSDSAQDKRKGETEWEAPFISTTGGWLNLALKRAIIMAVQGGYKKVAFANGEQNAKHYNLDKRISEIKYRVLNDNYKITATDMRGNQIRIPPSLDADLIEDYVGKEIANKIVDTATPEDQTLSGDGLKVEARGMREFYDKIVPNAVKALLKKFGGGSLETVELGEFRTSPFTGEKTEDFEVHTEQLGFDVTPEMVKKVEAGVPLFSKRDTELDPPPQNRIRNGTSAWDAPVNTGFDDVIYQLQNKMVDTKRIIDSITKTVGAIREDLNVYLQEELFHGRSAKRVSDFGADELNPLMEQIARYGYKIEDVEEYLHARHAKEANAEAARRDPTLPDGGSGMFNAEVDNYFNNLSAEDAQKLGDIANQVDAIQAKTRQMYVDYELESQDTVDAWGRMFQNYVPLHREDKKPNGLGIGQGFSIKGKETKGRTGSTRKVVNILAHIAMQREKLIVRGEKNRVSQALVGLAQSYPNPDFWSVGQPPGERVYDSKLKKVVRRSDPMYKSRDNVVVAKVNVNGKIQEMAVNFNERDDRAVRMAKALKNLDAGKLEGLLSVSAKITRYFSAVNTQYNPVFGVVNLVRDMQTALINLNTTPLAGKKGRISKDAVAALAGIYQDLRSVRKGGHPTSQWAQLFEEFQQEGGQTGYRQMFATSQDRANELQKILTPYGWLESGIGKVLTVNGTLKVPVSKLQDASKALFDWLSDYNESMENAVRLSTYKSGLDSGMSKQAAASLAKNLTVNFNRKGEKALQTGALYAFFNAAMQGSARIGETLFDVTDGNIKTARLSRFGKQVVYGGMLLGSMQALALAFGGFGDDDPPEFLRERSLILPTFGMIGPDKGYVSIPMPLGYHVIPGLGRHLTEFALHGFEKPTKRAMSIVSMFSDAFNPIGNAGLSLQTIAPTAIDPIAALTENKDWSGRPIARVSSNKALPGHTQFKDSATWYEKLIAEGINAISGGNDYVAGALSPTPDQIGYLIGQVTGGVGREISKVMQTSQNLVTGEELPLYKVPLVGRFIGNAEGQSNQANAFYSNVNKLNELETEIKGMRKDGKGKDAMVLIREHPEARYINMANVAERQVQKLRKEKRELIAKDAPKEAVRRKEEQITQAMTRFNKAMDSVQK